MDDKKFGDPRVYSSTNNQVDKMGSKVETMAREFMGLICSELPVEEHPELIRTLRSFLLDNICAKMENMDRELSMIDENRKDIVITMNKLSSIKESL